MGDLCLPVITVQDSGGSLLEECVIILDSTEEEADVITPQETM